MKVWLSGTRAWLVQRLCALYMLGFLVGFGLWLAIAAPGYDDWHGWIRSTGGIILMLGFFAALLMHSWVGLRDVILDYAHGTALRLALLGIAVFGLVAQALWVLMILLART